MRIAFVFVGLCIYYTMGAVWQERPNPKAGKGKCLSSSYPELGELKYGETYNVPRKCISVTCHKDGRVSGVGCSKVGVPDGCILEDTDYNKPHPDCCPRNYKC